MSENSAIEWTDHTFNPWWGCTRVSAACRFCYAETLAARFGTGWGKAAERRFFGDAHWNEPLKWNRKAQAAGVPARVFCASMADVFEDRPDLLPHRERLWDLIGRAPWLTWQLLTKRPENIASMVPWTDDWPANVWVGCTTEDQETADLRIPHLLSVNPVVRFLSYEPARSALTLDLTGISWLIAGGESGPNARPPHPDWFTEVRLQCEGAGVRFLFKQWGTFGLYPPGYPGPGSLGGPAARKASVAVAYDGRFWPTQELAIEFEEGHRYCDPFNRPFHYVHETGRMLAREYKPGGHRLHSMYRVGKKAAGRELDGQTWDQMPERVPA